MNKLFFAGEMFELSFSFYVSVLSATVINVIRQITEYFVLLLT